MAYFTVHGTVWLVFSGWTVKERACQPAGLVRGRGVIFPPKNKVEGLSPSTLWIV